VGWKNDFHTIAACSRLAVILMLAGFPETTCRLSTRHDPCARVERGAGVPPNATRVSEAYSCACPCPGGPSENSPTLQRWVHAPKQDKSRRDGRTCWECSYSGVAPDREPSRLAAATKGAQRSSLSRTSATSYALRAGTARGPPE